MQKPKSLFILHRLPSQYGTAIIDDFIITKNLKRHKNFVCHFLQTCFVDEAT